MEGGAEEAHLRTLLSAAPSHLPTRLRLATLLLAEDRAAEAEEAFRTVLERAPTLTHALLGATEALLRLGRLDEARARLATLRESAPPADRSALAMEVSEMAERIGTQGRLEAAEVIGWEAMAFADGLAAVWAIRGMVARDLGNVAEAAKRFSRALELDPNSERAALLLADAYARLEKREDAIELLSRHLSAPGVRERLADQLAAAGRAAEALAHYTQVTGDEASKERLSRKIAAMELAEGHAERAWSRRGGEGEYAVYRLTTSPPEETQVLETPGLNYVRLNGTETTERSFVAGLAGGGVLGRSNIPLTQDGRFFTRAVLHNDTKAMTFDADCYYDGVVSACPGQILAGVKSRRHMLKEAVLIGGSPNFGHWMFNHFARLMLVEGEAKLADYPLVVNGGLPPFAEQTLERAGYAQERLIRLAEGEVTTFDRLWVPSLPMFGAAGWLVWIQELLECI